MKHACLVTALVAVALWAGAAQATTITGAWDNSFANYTKYDVSTGADDWAAWAVTADEFTGLDKVTRKAGGQGEISAISGIIWSGTTSGRVKMSFSGGVGSNGAPDSFGLGSDSGDICFNKGQLVSFSTKLFAPDETLTLYVRSDNGLATLTANVGSDTYSLPEQTVGANTQGYGRFILNVTGGTVGQVLTFSSQSVFPQNQYNGVGIAAVSITGVPEPTTMVLLGLGAVAALRRRK